MKSSNYTSASRTGHGGGASASHRIWKTKKHHVTPKESNTNTLIRQGVSCTLLIKLSHFFPDPEAENNEKQIKIKNLLVQYHKRPLDAQQTLELFPYSHCK